MKLPDLIEHLFEPVPVKQRSVSPPMCGAFPEKSYGGFWFEDPNRLEFETATKIWDHLAQAGFGFAERPWLVAAGSCHLPREVSTQIEVRAQLTAAYIKITEEILDEKFEGSPPKLWELPTRNESHRATIVRLDDIPTEEGKFLATEPEGWSSGQGQIIATSDVYRKECGKFGLASPFLGIHAAAINVLTETFGQDANIAILVPEVPQELGWNFISKDFELFANYCRILGVKITVEKPQNLMIADNEISGKSGKYDVLYPFFPPAGFVDEKVTQGVGQKILSIWADGNVELFPEPSWLQTKLMMTAVFDPELKHAYKRKIAETEPDLANNPELIEHCYRMFQTELFPWSWSLDPARPPVLPTGEQMSWDEFLSDENLQKGWVFRPLLGTECAGLVFSDEVDPVELKQFAKKKLASFKPDEPYPLQPGTASKELREGATFENDYRSYFVQPKIPHEQFAVRYLNPKKTGLRTRKGFNSRICSTVFIDGSGKAIVGDCDVTLRQDKRVHGATNSVVTIATFEQR